MCVILGGVRTAKTQLSPAGPARRTLVDQRFGRAKDGFGLGAPVVLSLAPRADGQ